MIKGRETLTDKKRHRHGQNNLLGTVTVLTGLVCISIIVGAIKSEVNLYKERKLQLQTLMDEKSVLEGALSGQQTISAIGAQAYDDDVQLIKTINTMGVAVAELQNQYLYMEPLTTDNDNSIEKYAGNSEELKSYFDDSFFATQWFYCGESVKSDILWSLEPLCEMAGDGCDAVWTCRDETGCLLAYATGRYDDEMRKFVDMNVRMTTYGYYKSASYMDVSEDEGGDYDES